MYCNAKARACGLLLSLCERSGLLGDSSWIPQLDLRMVTRSVGLEELLSWTRAWTLSWTREGGTQLDSSCWCSQLDSRGLSVGLERVLFGTLSWTREVSQLDSRGSCSTIIVRGFQEENIQLPTCQARSCVDDIIPERSRWESKPQVLTPLTNRSHVVLQSRAVKKIRGNRRQSQ